MQLSELFNHRFDELKGTTTRERVATDIGIPPPTLRGYLRDNAFPDDIAIAVAYRLGITMSRDELLAHEHDRPRATGRCRPAQITCLQTAFDNADGRCEKQEASMAEGTETLNLLCSSMGEGDLRILLSATVTPLEFSKYKDERRRKQVEAAANAIAEGVANGGTFVYIRPEAALLEDYDQKWHFEGRWPTVEECRVQIAEFRDLVADHLVKAKGMSREDATGRAYRATPQYHATHTLPLWMPGLTIMMFRAEEFSGGEDDRFVIQLPDNEWARIYLRKAQHLRDRFLRCLRSILDLQLQQFTSDTGYATVDPNLSRDVEVAAELRNLMFS